MALGLEGIPLSKPGLNMRRITVVYHIFTSKNDEKISLNPEYNFIFRIFKLKRNKQ